LKRRNRIAITATAALATTAVAALPAGAKSDAVTGELGQDASKRGPFLVLTIGGTGAGDHVTVLKSSGDVVVKVPVPETITGPAECNEDSPQQFTCDESLGIDGIEGVMGPRRDRFVAQSSVDLPTNQFGGTGNDVLKGGSVFDLLNGQKGGDDRCKGRQGPETIKKCE
jgi:hypothetical protein